MSGGKKHQRLISVQQQTMRAALLGLMLVILPGSVTQAQSPLQKLLSGFDAVQEKPLPPDQAFQLDLQRGKANDARLRWNISKGYYLYREKIKVFQEGKELKLNKPPGETITDEFFGTTEIYRNPMQTPVYFRLREAIPGTQHGQTIDVSYQGCADQGICYPPITKTLVISDIPVTLVSFGDTQDTRQQSLLSEQDRIAADLSGRSLLMMTLIFLGFGLLLGLTPCVLPMIPILSGIIAADRQRPHSTGRAFALTTVYILSMAGTYALLGVLLGLSGANLQVWFQQTAVIVVFSGIFVALAMAMFGFYELRMPAALQTRLGQLGQGRMGHFGGSALMGSASALIVGPCVTPPLVGALLFVAKTGDALTGAVTLFALGLGMGVPLWVVGTSLGKWLPKPGPGLQRINGLLGLLLLGVAVWLLDRVLAPVVVQLLGGLLLVFGSIYLFRMGRGLRDVMFFWRGFSSATLIYGVLILIGVGVGGGGFLTPLSPFMQQEENVPMSFTAVKTVTDLEKTLEQATDKQRWSMLDFYADWCIACKELEALTFNQNKVKQALSGFVLLKADVTKNTQHDQQLLKQFNLYGPPAILFFGPDGQERRFARLVGFVGSDEFVEHLEHLKQKHQEAL